MKQIPILIATRTAHGLLKAWCRFCQKHHYHGGNGGHRQAHCADETSPYRATGYELVVVADDAQETGQQLQKLRLVKKHAA